MKKHTPGPWYYHESVNAHDQGLIISEETGANVAVVYNGKADTSLIAAAPELLEALESIYPVACRRLSGTTQGEPILAKVREALSKAKGL